MPQECKRQLRKGREEAWEIENKIMKIKRRVGGDSAE